MSFPTTAAPSLTAWQMSYQGLTLGPSTPYSITAIDGLGQPNMNSGDDFRPRDQGEFIGYDYYSGRDFTVDGFIQSDGTSLQNAIKALATATNRTVSDPGTEYPLWFAFPNIGTLATMSRLRKRDIPFALETTIASKADMALMFHSTDPRWYASPTTTSVALGTPGTGATFNVSFNVSFGGGSSGGTTTVTNAGNYETRPILTITGPCTNPSVSNNTTGQTLLFNLVVGAYDKLVIDTDMRSATYTTFGTTIGSTRLGSLVAGSSWFTLAPGNSTLVFQSSDAGAVAGTLQVQYSSAYIF